MDEVWKWTPKRALAAQLLAESLLSLKEIAAKVGVREQALRNWRYTAEFKARVEELAKEFRERVANEGIAVLENRVRGYNDRWKKMNQVIEERAKDPGMQDVPGGKTGLLVHKIKSVGAGEFAQMVDEYEVDAGLLKELREHEEQAARELGQWTDKATLGNSGGPLIIQFASIPAPPWAQQTENS